MDADRVTPDRDREPQEIEESSELRGAPVADPPKPPELPEDEEPPEIETPDEDDDGDDEEEDVEDEDQFERQGFTVLRATLGAAGAGTAALMMIGASIVGYKAMRRRRRRNADVPAASIAGAWAELIDRVDEAGGGLPLSATPTEAAAHARAIDALGHDTAAAQVGRLADQVSTAAFHPHPPSVDSAHDAWQTYDALVASLNADTSAADRLRRAVDPRTLREHAGSR